MKIRSLYVTTMMNMLLLLTMSDLMKLVCLNSRSVQCIM